MILRQMKSPPPGFRHCLLYKSPDDATALAIVSIFAFQKCKHFCAIICCAVY